MYTLADFIKLDTETIPVMKKHYINGICCYVLWRYGFFKKEGRAIREKFISCIKTEGEFIESYGFKFECAGS